MLLDAHAHLDRYIEDQVPELLAEIDDLQVLTLANTVDIESFERTKAIAEQSPLVVPGFGIHPWEAPLYDEDPGRYRDLFDDAAYVGEVGLDRRFVDEVERYPAQHRLFEYQLGVAVETGKLVNVHTSGAEHEVLAALRSFSWGRVIIHWYAGPIDVLRRMIDEGYSFTVGVEVLLSGHIRDIARLIPDGQLLTETDNPGGADWLTGRLEMPSLVQRVLEAVADVRGTDAATLAELVFENFVRLVGDDPAFAPWAEYLSP